MTWCQCRGISRCQYSHSKYSRRERTIVSPRSFPAPPVNISASRPNAFDPTAAAILGLISQSRSDQGRTIALEKVWVYSSVAVEKIPKIIPAVIKRRLP